MPIPESLRTLFTEQAAQQNHVTHIEIAPQQITVYLQPAVAITYVRPDCHAPVSVQPHDRETIVVQGLGVQGRALRYVVETQRVAYVNDVGKFVTFMVPLPGIRTDLCVSAEVVERALYFMIDCNLPVPLTTQMLHSLSQIETSDTALARWKSLAAEQLPSVGVLIQRLNGKKR